MKFSEGLFYRLLRIIFGLLILLIGFLKMLDIPEFSANIRAYNLLPDELSTLIAITISFVEILIGLSFIFKLYIKHSSALAILLFVFFGALISMKLIEGAKISCGCFGSLSPQYISPVHLIIDFAFLSCAIALRKHYCSNLPNNLSLKGMTNLIIILFLSFEVILLSFQNIALNKRLNKTYSLNTGDKISDFAIHTISGNQNKFTISDCPALFFIFSTKCDACVENMEYWSYIYETTINTHKYNILGISMNTIEETRELIDFYQPDYPVFTHPDSSFHKIFDIRFTPQTILVDRKGYVIDNWIGVLDSAKISNIIDNVSTLRK